MSAPKRSPALHLAIDRTYPALPSLLGADFPAFDGELQHSLQSSSDSQLLNLFTRHPAGYDHLLRHVAQLSITPSFFGDSLFGNPQIKISIKYHCQVGPHDVALQDVQQHTAAGDPICPIHDIIMIV